jgi:lysozyme
MQGVLNFFKSIIEKLKTIPEKLKKLPELLKHIPKPVAIGGIIVVAALLIGFGVYQIWRNFSTTTIKGIDVSNYQGNISWRAVAENGNAKFVYIKATEGKTYQDPFFKKNWNGAAKNGIPEGAYHFFTMTSSGTDQANNFISMVPKAKGKLPPAVDVESSITKESDFKTQLADYVQTITKYYGQKPVFYVSNKVYNILYDDYSGYDFWIINYTGDPAVKGWTFWQYSEKGTSAGIDGKIDLDQYKGSLWNFGKLFSK